MNLLKQFWNWFTTLKAGGCCGVPHEVTPVEVEETFETCGELFNIICIEAGISQRALDKGKIVVLFEDWYVGPCTRAAIAASIDAFRSAHAIANAKLNGGKF